MRCYFNQFASRDRQGYCWRKTHVRDEWLREFKRNVWDDPDILPGSGTKIVTPCGGFFRAPSGDFFAVFKFRPAPPDSFGRTGGIVANVLFFDQLAELKGKSLKKVWEAPVLKIGPLDEAENMIDIFPGWEFGVGNERPFFACHDRTEYKVILYPSLQNGGMCKIIEGKGRTDASVFPQTTRKYDGVREHKRGEIMNFSQSHFYVFAAGVIAGVCMTSATVWCRHHLLSGQSSESSAYYEFDLSKNGSATFRVSCVLKAGNRVKLRVMPVDFEHHVENKTAMKYADDYSNQNNREDNPHATK